MHFKKSLTLATALSLLLGGTTLRAADNDALLNLLVRKHIISEKDAVDVRSELKAEEAKAPPVTATSASKLKLSTPITELELYGDARVRYEARSGETAAPDGINPHGDTFQRNRARYRLRLGLKSTLVDDWFFGIRLETSTNPRSTTRSRTTRATCISAPVRPKRR